MWRKTLHDEVGLFDVTLKSAGDYDFWMRCLINGKIFYKINIPHVVYFQNPHGISTRPDTLGIEEASRVLRKHAPRLVPESVFSDHTSLPVIGSAYWPAGVRTFDPRTEFLRHGLGRPGGFIEDRRRRDLSLAPRSAP